MRKLIIISIVIFWAAVIGVFGNGLKDFKKTNFLASILPGNTSFEINNSSSTYAASSPNPGSADIGQPEQNQTSEGLDNSAPGTTNSQENILNAQTVAAHNSADDCWMIINGDVYNFTDYLPMHPGGPATMAPYCGKDASSAYQSKDQNPPKPHSQYATDLLQQFYVGKIGQRLGGSSAVQMSDDNSANSAPSSPASNNSSIAAASPNRTSTPRPTAPATPNTLPPPSATPAPTTPNPSPTPTPSNQPISYTIAQVAAHNSQNNCWLIVSNKVYNVTSYLPYHPGGIIAILPYCGKDATSAFASHSQNAVNLLSSYFVGNLKNNLPAPTSPAPTPSPSPIFTPTPVPNPSPTPSLTPPPTPTPTPLPSPIISPTPAPKPKPSPSPSPTPRPPRREENEDDDDNFLRPLLTALI